MEHGKRKHEEIRVEELPDKRAKVEITTNLLDLSDDVLLCIIRLLNSYELLNLSEVCTRFDRVTGDESLWKCVDTRDHPLKPHRFRKLLRFMGQKTKVIRIGGKPGCTDEMITPSILEAISKNCPNLEELTFHQCHINAEK